ncbi:MAG: hypothetical protein QOH29_29, partial [Actinomycetota bacterium]|nr:hypothetical protein [Actinomycetota bacterium]
ALARSLYPKDVEGRPRLVPSVSA